MIAGDNGIPKGKKELRIARSDVCSYSRKGTPSRPGDRVDGEAGSVLDGCRDRGR